MILNTKPTPEIVKTLTAARGLIAASDKLSKKAFAKNSRGKTVAIDSPDATSFCIAGAVARIDGVLPDETGYLVVEKSRALKYMTSVLGGQHQDAMDIASFNDAPKTKKEDVLTFFDIIIAKAKADRK